MHAEAILHARQSVRRALLQAFQALAEGLPRAKHVHSKLVCYVTGQIMDEHNLPMVMPNGTVYSEAAVRLLTGPDGRTFTCPKSGGYTLPPDWPSCNQPLAEVSVETPDARHSASSAVCSTA